MYRAYIKPTLDFILALCGTVILIIPSLIIALLIKLDSKGSVLFAHTRCGRYKKPFTIYKFRTMYTTAPTDCPTNELRNPTRHITRVGKFLRKTSLDELPQLINILRGEMSLVGPRPVLFAEEFLINEREKRGVNDIRPGITGWAQVNGRDHVPARTKARLDGEYVKNMSFLFDAKCFLRTVWTVVSRHGHYHGISDSIRQVRITFVCQYFYPEQNGYLSYELARSLSENGYEVKVIAGRKVKNISGSSRDISSEMIGDIAVNRIPYVDHDKTSKLGRVRNFLSFFVAIFKYRHLLKNSDIVVTYSSPPINPIVPALYTKRYSYKLIYILHDLYPDIAYAFKHLSPQSPMSCTFNTFINIVYRRSSAIIVLSKDMQEYFSKNKGYSDKIHVIPNWYTYSRKPSIEVQHSKTIKILYGGNLGTAQDTRTLLKGINNLSNSRNIVFEFLAYGNKKDDFFANIDIRRITYVNDHAFMPKDEYDKFIQRIDLAIVSVEKSVLGLASPSKFCSYIAQGTPVIFIGPAEMEIAQDIMGYNAGIVIPNGKHKLFAETVLQLRKDREALGIMKMNAYRLYKDKYTLKACTKKYITIIDKAVSEKGGA